MDKGTSDMGVDGFDEKKFPFEYSFIGGSSSILINITVNGSNVDR